MLDIQNLFRQRYFYLVVALIPVAILIAGMLVVSSSPYIGASFTSIGNKYEIKHIDSHSPLSGYPEITDKEIISIGEWHPVRWDITKNPNMIIKKNDYEHYRDANKYFSDYLKPGSITYITIIDKGSPKTIGVTPVTTPVAAIFSRTYSFVLSALIILTVGLLIIWRKPHEAIAQTFFMFTFFIALYLISVSIFLAVDIPSISSTFFNSLVIVRNLSIYLLSVTLIHFFLIFPYRLNFKWYPALLWGLYISPFVITIIYELRLFSMPSALYLDIILDIIACTILLYRYFKAVLPEHKIQVRIVLASFITCYMVALGYILLISSNPAHHIDASAIIWVVNLVPLTIAFAIQKYKLLDIDTLFDNTLIYMVTLGIFAVIDIAFIYILSLNHLTTLNVSDLWWAVVGVWFIIFSYIPVRNSVQVLVKKLLKREIYNTDKVIIEFQKQLLSADDPDRIKNILINTIEKALHPKKLGFVTIGNNPGESLSFQLKGLNEDIGTLYLSDKHSGNTYTKEDIKLVETLANMAAIVIESIKTREKAILEKQEIAREIHDNIGHSLIMAKYMARETSRGKELENILDNGLSDLREVLSLADGEKQILADFIEQVYKRSEYLKNNPKIRLTIETKTEDETIELPYQVRSNLMKIIQEGISNAIKYSGGDNIKICIEQVKNELTISITDNGKGFDTSKELPGKHKGLRNMSQRAELIGGNFSITSSVGNGTAVSVKITI